LERFSRGTDFVLAAIPNKRLEWTRHKRASFLSCVGEPLKLTFHLACSTDPTVVIGAVGAASSFLSAWASPSEALCGFPSNRRKPIILTVKVKEVIKLLEQDGWYLARTKGSHRQFKHLEKSGPVQSLVRKALTYHAAL
jgi:hypothetical protein